MTRKLGLTILILTNIICSSCNKVYYSPIYYEDYKVLVNFNNVGNNKNIKIGKSRTFLLPDSSLLRIKLLSETGKASITIKDKKGNKVVTGLFDSNPTLATEELQIKDLVSGKLIDYSTDYYLPYKSGKWDYYDDSGKVIKEESWKHGKLQK